MGKKRNIKSMMVSMIISSDLAEMMKRRRSSVERGR